MPAPSRYRISADQIPLVSDAEPPSDASHNERGLGCSTGATLLQVCGGSNGSGGGTRSDYHSTNSDGLRFDSQRLTSKQLLAQPNLHFALCAQRTPHTAHTTRSGLLVWPSRPTGSHYSSAPRTHVLCVKKFFSFNSTLRARARKLNTS